MEDKIIRMYGVYDDGNVLIDRIPAFTLEDAIKIYKNENPDKEYLYIEVLY